MSTTTIAAGYIKIGDEILLNGTWQQVTGVRRSTRVAANTLTLADGTRLPIGLHTPMDVRPAA